MSSRRTMLLGYLSTLLFPLHGSEAQPPPGTPSWYRRSTATPPPDTNVYPLTMQPVTKLGDPVTLGSGPDALVVRLASQNNNVPARICSVALILDGVVIAGPLTVTGNGDPLLEQIFTIKGSWGPPPHTLQIVSGLLPGAQLRDLWVAGVSFNFIAGGYTGPSTDARGGPAIVAALSVWDNRGVPLTFKIPADVGSAPPSAAGPATIAGASINGVTHAPAPLGELVAATPAGGTLLLPQGTWAGATVVGKSCTIKGAGMGKTIIDATGVELARGKGIFVPMVAGVAFADMTLKGAAVSDDNGAGIREDGPDRGWTATNVEFTGNQDGILTFASNITLTTCSFHGNGAHDEHSHEIYLNGSPTTQVTLNNVTSICGTGSTHALKSRAGTTQVEGGSYTGNPGAEGGDVTGSVLNFPDCGVVTVTGAILTVASHGSDPNILFISYGTESAKNAATGNTVTLTNVHLIDRSGTGGVIGNGRALPSARLVIGPGCVYDGTKPPRFQGWASVSGSFTASGAAIK